jgi:hypothetical protein
MSSGSVHGDPAIESPWEATQMLEKKLDQENSLNTDVRAQALSA